MIYPFHIQGNTRIDKAAYIFRIRFVFESPPDDDDPEQPEEAVMAARAAARLDAWTKPRRVRKIGRAHV